jgi:hypothetical protein
MSQVTNLPVPPKAPASRKTPDYLLLSRWPELAAPRTVHLNMATRGPGVRVPVAIMRACGMYPERGVNVAVFGDRVLIRGNECGGRYVQEESSRQLILAVTGISPAVAKGNFAVVEGPDYLVLTTPDDAAYLGAGAPTTTRTNPHRMDKVGLPQAGQALAASAVEILGWKDVTLGHTMRDRSSRVANVSGHLWWMAGFACGDALRFTKHANATVVQRCAETEKHSTLKSLGHKQIPRHYFGATLVDLRNVDAVRVIASTDKLIVTRPDSDIAALCTPETHQVAPPRRAPVPQAAEPGMPLVELDTASIIAVRAKRYRVSKERLTVSGAIWGAAGFTRLQPAKLVQYENALAVIPCDEDDMDFRIGTASQKNPYRNLGLAGTVLKGSTSVQVVATAGRLILTRPGTKFGKAPVGKPGQLQPQSAPLAQPTPLVQLDRAGLTVLQTKLYTLRSGWVNLGKPVCGAAGFLLGQPIRVVHHADAVVVEVCADADMTDRVKHRNGEPHVHVELRKTVLADELRVQAQAVPGRVVLVKPKRGPLGDHTTPMRAQAEPPAAAGAFAGVTTGVLKARRCRVKANRIALRGALMAAAGFSPNDPVRVVRYADALVLESCSAADMDGVVRKENGSNPVVSVALAGSSLENKDHVLALAARGRIVLVLTDYALDPEPSVGADYALDPEPSVGAEPVHAEEPVPAPVPLAEVCRYQVPVGKRLQMQGRWLNQFGFVAGAKYQVHADGDKVVVALCAAAKSTVTAHSATASKLYVPASSLTAMVSKDVQVRARHGHLELIAA